MERAELRSSRRRQALAQLGSIDGLEISVRKDRGQQRRMALDFIANAGDDVPRPVGYISTRLPFALELIQEFTQHPLKLFGRFDHFFLVADPLGPLEFRFQLFGTD